MYANPIALDQFSPDLATNTPGILTDCQNLVATNKGLRVLPGWRRIPGADIGSRHTIGCYTAILTNGAYVTFATVLRADGFSGIYRYDPATDSWFLFQGSLPLATRMRFTTFGNHVIAVNGSSVPAIYRDGTDALFVPLHTVSDLPDTYIASTVCVVDTGILLAKAGSDEWRFSPADLSWAPSKAALRVISGTPGLIGPSGPITGMVAVRGDAVAFKANSFYRGGFVGSPFAYGFKCVSETIGCQWQEAIVSTGDVLLFPGPDDFWAFDGSSLMRIPNNLKDWFYRRIRPLQSAFVQNDPYPNIIGRWDSQTSVAVWHYAIPADEDGVLAEWIALNTQTGKWTKGTRDVTDVVQPFFPVRDASQNVIQRVPAIMDDAFTLALQDGPPDPSFLVTGEFGDGAALYQLNRLRPLFSEYPSDRAAVLQAYKRMQFGYPYPDFSPLPKDSRGPQAWLTDDGAFNLIQTARSHQFRIDFAADAEITAIQADFIPAGEE